MNRTRQYPFYLIVIIASATVFVTFVLRSTHIFHNHTASVIVTGVAALGTLLAVTVAFMALEETARQAREVARQAEESRHDAVRPVIRVLRHGRIDRERSVRELEFRAHNYGRYPASSIYMVYWIPWDNHDDPWENLTETVDTKVLLPFPAQPAAYVSPSLSGVEVNHDLFVSQSYVLDERNLPTQAIKITVDCLYEDILGWWWMTRLFFSIGASDFPGGREWMGGGQPIRIKPPPWIHDQSTRADTKAL